MNGRAAATASDPTPGPLLGVGTEPCQERLDVLLVRHETAQRVPTGGAASGQGRTNDLGHGCRQLRTLPSQTLVSGGSPDRRPEWLISPQRRGPCIG